MNVVALLVCGTVLLEKPHERTGERKMKNEPTHEIMALIALRKLNLQTRMCSNPLGLDV